MTDRGITAELVESVRRLRFADLPDEVVEVAGHCLLDGIGVTVAGSREPLAAMVRRVVGATTEELPEGCTLVGRPERCPPLDAALANGAAAHALDFDDTHGTMSGHPTVPVLPAVLALVERRGGSGRDLLTSLVAGIELECRLGALVNPEHYRRGFHATGTLGTFGAAAAAAWLLDLDVERWQHALGLAATQAAGLKSAFGSMAKPLHAGKAAQSGLLAAQLAAEGFTGPRAVVEAEQGFFEVLVAEEGLSDLAILHDRLVELRDRFLIRETLFKVHAACYLTHSAIEGGLALREAVVDGAGGLDGVERVQVEVAPSSLRVCNIERPSTGLEGKFSLRTTTAMALLGDDTTDLAAFSDERMAAADLVALRDRIEIEPVSGVSPTRSVVTVHASGREPLRASVDVGQPAADLTVQRERLRRKFVGLVSPILGEAGCEALLEGLDGLGEAERTEALLSATRPLAPSVA